MTFRVLRSMATMSRNVVVALDSSGPSTAAMKWAVKNFKAPDTQFHFVRCFEPLMTYASDEFTFVPSADDQTKYINAHHKEIDATIKVSVPANEKVNFQKHLVEGDPRNVLCEMASALKAEAVVLGSHGKGVVKRALLGSVSNHVAQHATVPVVIVRGENAPDV